MNQKVRAGETVTEEFRMIRDVRDRLDTDEVFAPGWYRLTVRPQDHEDHKRPLLVWEMSDVTQERARQESVFQELQHAIDYLDHAPAGFFSADAEGSIVYLNATLADWLGIDLAQFKPGVLTISELVLGDEAALLQALEGEPGQSGTSVVDLDLTRSNGQSLRCGFTTRCRTPVTVHGVPHAHWC